MWGLIIEAALGALKAIFGLGAPKEPTPVDLATKAATSSTQLEEEQAANVVLTEGAAARAAADAHSLPGSGPAAAVNVDPAAPVNSSPDAHFRD